MMNTYPIIRRSISLTAMALLMAMLAACDEQKTVKPTDAPDARLEKPANEDAASLADGRRLIERIAAARDGSVLRIPAGRYLTAGPIAIHRKRDLTLIFEDTYIYCRDTNANVLEISESKDIRIVGGHFRHDKSKPQYECHGSVAAVASSQNVAIYSAELNGCGAVGLYATGCLSLTVFNCHIHLNSFNAFYLMNCDGVKLVRNQVANNASMMQAVNVTGLEMMDNVIYGNRGYWQTGDELNKRYLELLNLPETR